MADISKIEEFWDDNPIDVSAEVNFIWSIANKLRGPYQSDKYKDVIIPMVIIRRLNVHYRKQKMLLLHNIKRCQHILQRLCIRFLAISSIIQVNLH